MYDMQRIRKICIDEDVNKELLELVSVNSRNETGGIFLGVYDNSGTCCTVKHATGPGPRSVVSPSHVFFDADYLQMEQDRVLAKKPHYKFLGDWHYHTNKRKKPSQTDVAGLWSLSNDADYRLGRQAVIVILSKHWGKIKMSGYAISSKNSIVEVPVEVKVIK